MKNCMGCKYAEWNKTKSGRLHPNGEGRCKVEIKIPPLPESMHWSGWGAPYPSGGHIERKKELKTDCVYYQGGHDAE